MLPRMQPSSPFRPMLEPLRPEDAASTLGFHPASAEPRGGVLVLPGGGYGAVADGHEGRDVAAALNAAGFDAAVLRYRVAPHRHPAMIHDAAAGLRRFRRALAEAGRSMRIGLLGFSAGGHLAASLALHGNRFEAGPDAGTDSSPGPGPDLRVDALVLGYPVIDLVPPRGHANSGLNLLGPEPDAELLDLFCLHRHVGSDAPPALLWHTADDGPVPVGNSLAYASACEAAEVPFELRVYEQGQHGLGLAREHPEAKAWFPDAVAFLGRHLGA